MSDERPWNAQDKARWMELDSMAPADLVRRCFDAEIRLGELAARWCDQHPAREYFGRCPACVCDDLKAATSRLDAVRKHLEERMRGSTHWGECYKQHWPCELLRLINGEPPK